MNKPNVLFLLKGLETGGLEVVTAVLANKFVTEGHSVSVFAFLGGKNSIADRFDKRIKLYLQNDYSQSRKNVEENAAAFDWSLSDEEMAKLDRQIEKLQ